jgi:hypothetical protein
MTPTPTPPAADPAPPPDYRSHAAFLVGASALVLLLGGVVLQHLVVQLEDYYRTRYKLPALAKLFFDAFGRRSDGNLTQVLFGLWWPMTAAFAYCHFRHKAPHDFAVAFLYWFLCCWMLVAVVLTFMGVACITPMIGIGEDLHESPWYMQVGAVVSWLLPVAVLGFAVVCWRRFRRGAGETTASPPGA